MIARGAQVLKCACCDMPFARIENGVLIIESRHHGEKHRNVIALSELARASEGNATLN